MTNELCYIMVLMIKPLFTKHYSISIFSKYTVLFCYFALSTNQIIYGYYKLS